MRIDKINYPALEWVKNKRISSDIDFSQMSLTKDQKSDIRSIVNTILKGESFRCEFASNPIIEIIDYNQKNIEAFSKLRDEDHEGVGLFMYNNKGVNISILYSIKNGISGFNGLPEDIMSNTKKTIITYCFYRNVLIRGFVSFLQGKEGKHDKHSFLTGLCHIHPKDNINHIDDDYQLVDDFMIFKKYADLQTKVLPPKAGMDFINCKYVNDTNKQVTIFDSTYFTTLIKSDAFKVRGHFRVQPCGEGLKDKKLIWIKDFKKDGYTRLAGKLN